MNALALQPEITILITAHNEADRIQPCLHSIMAQDYPMERVEILVVDDRSTDGTAERALAMKLPGLRVLRIDQPPEKLTARQVALDLGFREARGEVVLVTDAGGRVPREWLRELTGHLGYRDGAATAPVVFAGGRFFFDIFQTLETMVALTLNRWANRHGKPSGVFSANVAVRREAYLETGGFPVIGFALAEDLALGEALCRAGWSIRYLTEPATQNPACNTLAELVARSRRRAWNTPPLIRSLTLLVIISNVLLVALALVFGGFWSFLLLVRYLVGMLFIGILASQYGSYGTIQWAWSFEPFMTLLGLWVHLANWLQPHWTWGGIRYDRPHHPAFPTPPTPDDPAAPPPAEPGALDG